MGIKKKTCKHDPMLQIVLVPFSAGCSLSHVCIRMYTVHVEELQTTPVLCSSTSKLFMHYIQYVLFLW